MTTNAPRTHRLAARLVGIAAVVAVASGAATIPTGVAQASMSGSTTHASKASKATQTLTLAQRYPAGVDLTGSKTVRPAAQKMSTRVATVPASVDLSGYSVAVKNQDTGSIPAHGSCVGWAVGYALMGLEARHAGLADPHFAAYYVYSQINSHQDLGSWPIDAMNVLATQGVDTLPHYWQQAAAYDDVFTQPDASERANAAQWKVRGVHNWFNNVAAGINGVALIKNALASGHPVAISIPVRKGFDAMMGTGVTVDRDNTTVSRGGHEILAVGYNTTGLLIQNSWGPTFGSGGFAYLDWSVVQTDVNSAFSIDGFAGTTTTSTDTTPPVVSAPSSLPQLYSTLSTAGVTPYVTSFSASDAGGIAQTALDVSVDGAAFTALTLPSKTAVSGTFDMTPGHTYRFVAAAADAAGNWSAWVYGPTFSVGSYSEASASYTTGWVHSTWASAVGGALNVSSTPSASTSITFTGRGIAWVATRGTNRGQANVYIDGVFKGTWDLYAASTQARLVVMTYSSTTSATHTLKVVVVGTTGRPSVDVDNFIITG